MGGEALREGDGEGMGSIAQNVPPVLAFGAATRAALTPSAVAPSAVAPSAVGPERAPPQPLGHLWGPLDVNSMARGVPS